MSVLLLEIQLTGARFGCYQEKFDKKAISGLVISIEECRIWPLAGKIRQNSLNVVSGLKIDGCMHPLPQIDGCSCTLRTRTNQGPVIECRRSIYF